MIDATIVPVPKQRNSRDENEAVKAGRAEGRHGAASTNEVPRSASDQDRLLPSVGTDGTRP